MLLKTRGIVLQKIKYSESSVIAKIYTEQSGLQSFIVYGIRGRKAKVKLGYLQPLSLLDMVVNYSERSGIHKINELRNAYHFQSIPFDIVKSSILLFLNEVLSRSLKEQEENSELFSFIFDAICILDNFEGKCSNFHLLFLVRLSRYLGFFPLVNHSNINNCFNISEGMFVNRRTGGAGEISGLVCKEFIEILEFVNREDVYTYRKAIKYRKELLEKTLLYYKYHISDFGEVNSHHILEDVFS